MKISVFYDHILQAKQQSGKSLEELLAGVREAGVEAVEICLAYLLEHEETLSLLRQAGLAVSCIYEFYEMDSHNEAEKARKHIEMAHRVQADRILVVPGFLSEEESKEIPGILQSYEKTAEFMENNAKIQRMAEGLRYVVGLGAEAGIAVTVEDFDDRESPLSFANGISWFLNTVPGLRYTLDMGNFIVYGEDVLEVWERFRDKISHVHCKDRGEDFLSVSAGEGTIPIDKLIGCLKACGYHGYLAIEHFDAPNQEECIRRSAVFLRETITLN